MDDLVGKEGRIGQAGCMVVQKLRYRYRQVRLGVRIRVRVRVRVSILVMIVNNLRFWNRFFFVLVSHGIYVQESLGMGIER